MAIYNKSGSQIDSAYSLSGTLNNAYDLSGDIVWVARSHAVSNNFTSDLLFEISTLPDGTQGIACDSLSQKIAQFFNGRIVMIDSTDGSHTEVGRYDIGHGSTGQFKPEKENVTDAYPLLYISTQSTVTINNISYSIFLEVNVDESSSVINRSFYVPLSTDTGYTLFAFDFPNGIVYSVWFSGYYDTTGTGKISAYRLSDFTVFADGSSTPIPVNGYWVAGNPIEEYDIDFIPEVQAITFFDGMVCCLCDYPHTNGGSVVFLDVENHDVYLTLDISHYVYFEREGITFILNPTTNKYDMILSMRQYESGVQVKKYYRFQFS